MTFHELNLKAVKDEIATIGHVRPRVNVILTTGKFIYLDYNPDDDKQKSEMQDLICSVIMWARLAGQLQCAAFLSEAWISKRPADDPMPRLRASEDPERKEGVFVITWEGDKRTIDFFDLVRESGAPELRARGDPFSKTEMWLDRAFSAFPPFPVPDHIRDAAGKVLLKMFPSKKGI